MARWMAIGRTAVPVADDPDRPQPRLGRRGLEIAMLGGADQAFVALHLGDGEGVEDPAAAFLVDYAIRLYERGRIEDAIHEFSKALLIEPDNPRDPRQEQVARIMERYDLYAGFRYHTVRSKSDVTGFPNISGDGQWADPLVGGRVRVPVSEPQSLELEGIGSVSVTPRVNGGYRSVPRAEYP